MWWRLNPARVAGVLAGTLAETLERTGRSSSPPPRPRDGGDRGLRGGSGGEAALDVRRAGGEARAGGGASVVGRAVAAQHLLDQIEQGSDAVEVSRARASRRVVGNRGGIYFEMVSATRGIRARIAMRRARGCAPVAR